MKLNKSMLRTAGMIAGAAVVVNVGMYFFLRATQPKMGERVTAATAQAEKSDSTALDSSLTAMPVSEDSTLTDTIASPVLNAAEQPLAEQTSSREPVTAETTPDQTLLDAAVAETEEPAEQQITQTEEAQSTADSPQTSGREAAKLAKMLESMKPDEAAAIVSQLGTEEIVDLVMRMKDRNAAKVIAALPVEQAARVATLMSQMADRGRRGS